MSVLNDTKQFDSEDPGMLGLWGMRSTPSVPLLPDPLWPGMVAVDKALCYYYSQVHSNLECIYLLNFFIWRWFLGCCFFVFCFNGLLNFVGYLMPNTSLKKTAVVLFNLWLGIRDFMPFPRVLD